MKNEGEKGQARSSFHGFPEGWFDGAAVYRQSQRPNAKEASPPACTQKGRLISFIYSGSLTSSKNMSSIYCRGVAMLDRRRGEVPGRPPHRERCQT
jgi:hypothetical protein